MTQRSSPETSHRLRICAVIYEHSPNHARPGHCTLYWATMTFMVRQLVRSRGWSQIFAKSKTICVTSASVKLFHWVTNRHLLATGVGQTVEPDGAIEQLLKVAITAALMTSASSPEKRCSIAWKCMAANLQPISAKSYPTR